MIRTNLQQPESPSGCEHPVVLPLPLRNSPARGSFLTILKIRELKRRRRRTPENE